MLQRKTGITGHVDGIINSEVCGWVWDPSNPLKRLEVLIVEDKHVLARQVANGYRKDLESAKIGDGKYHFRIPIPDELDDGSCHRLHIVVNETDNVEIQGSPLDYQAKVDPIDHDITGDTLQQRLSFYNPQRHISSQNGLESFAKRIAKDIGGIARRYGTEMALSAMYIYFLKRPIDPSGLQSRMPAIERGDLNYFQVALDILQSDEMKNLGFGHLVFPKDPEYPLKAWI